MITQQGLLNTTNLSTPGVYVIIVPPQLILNGVPSSYIGVVGVASWGPVNQPVLTGNPAQASQAWGIPALRANDISTHLAIAYTQGASAAYGVRVSDGTDTAANSGAIASGTLDSTYDAGIVAAINSGQSQIRSASNLIVASSGSGGLTLTALYTGSKGNSIGCLIAPGTKAGTAKVMLTLDSRREVFDNIPSTASPAPGVASAFTVAFTGGTDGASGVTPSMMLGQDAAPRTGLYALRGKLCTAFALADVSDTTTWAAQAAYALSEGSYGMVVGAPGQTILQAAAAKATAGIDTPWLKVIVGDWCYWNDTKNGVPMRLVSPAAFFLGTFGNLSPEQSSLNLQVQGVVATQTSNQGLAYASSDIGLANANGLDLIANPSPGGSYFAAQSGLNASSNAAINGDNWTRMTSYIAQTLNTGLGKYVGTLQSADQRRRATNTLNAFFAQLSGAGMIGNAEGTTPWLVALDNTTNDPTMVALGYEQASAQVTYLSVTRFFLLDLEAGQTVQIVDPLASYTASLVNTALAA